MAQFDVKVEIAFTTGPDSASPVWVDVTNDVRGTEGFTITRGRQDEFSDVQAGTLTLRLDNPAGRYTPGNTAGSNWPNIKLRRRIRIRYSDGAGGWYPRYDGYIDSWTPQWDASINKPVCDITATDYIARLGRQLPLRGVVNEEILSDAPCYYFALADASGSVQAAPISTLAGVGYATTQQIGSGVAQILFGYVSPTIGEPQATVANFFPISQANGLFLQSSLTGDAINSLINSTDLTLEGAFQSTTLTFQTIQILGNNSPTQPSFEIGVDATGHVFGSTAGSTITTTQTYLDGKWHHVALTYAGGSTTLTLYVDGVSIGSVVVASSISAGNGFVTAIGGGHGYGSEFNGSLAHIAGYPVALTPARIASHAKAITTGFLAETSDARVARWLGYAGVPSNNIVTQTGSALMAPMDTAGFAVLDLIRAAAEAENGVYFVDTQGRNTWQARRNRYDPTPVQTISNATTADELGDMTLTFAIDDRYMVNDVQIGIPNGSLQRAFSAQSLQDNGIYRDHGRILNLTTDVDALNAATWEVLNRATAIPRAPAILVDLQTTTSLRVGVLALDVSSCVQVTNLPVSAPASTYVCFVEGMVETRTVNTWTVSLITSPVGLYGALAQFDNTTNGRFAWGAGAVIVTGGTAIGTTAVGTLILTTPAGACLTTAAGGIPAATGLERRNRNHHRRTRISDKPADRNHHRARCLGHNCPRPLTK